MSNQDILNQLLPLIQTENEVSLETPCDQFLDSLAFIELILHAEVLFGITTSDEDLFLENYVTVNDFINMIKSHIINGGEQ